MLTLLSLCVAGALLLPLCTGSTPAPEPDEVTPTLEYSDYTFEYEAYTINYELYEILHPDAEPDIKAVNNPGNEASTIAHGCYTVLLGLMVQLLCYQI